MQRGTAIHSYHMALLITIAFRTNTAPFGIFLIRCFSFLLSNIHPYPLRNLSLSFFLVCYLSLPCSFSKSPALAALFLLNNYHYIAKTAARARLDLGIAGELRFRSLTQQARETYRTVTWSKLLGFISLKDLPLLMQHTQGRIVSEKAKPVRRHRSPSFFFITLSAFRLCLSLGFRVCVTVFSTSTSYVTPASSTILFHLLLSPI